MFTGTSETFVANNLYNSPLVNGQRNGVLTIRITSRVKITSFSVYIYLYYNERQTVENFRFYLQVIPCMCCLKWCVHLCIERADVVGRNIIYLMHYLRIYKHYSSYNMVVFKMQF